MWPKYCADSASVRFGVGDSVKVKPKPPLFELEGIMMKTKEVLKERTVKSLLLLSKLTGLWKKAVPATFEFRSRSSRKSTNKSETMDLALPINGGEMSYQKQIEEKKKMTAKVTREFGFSYRFNEEEEEEEEEENDNNFLTCRIYLVSVPIDVTIKRCSAQSSHFKTVGPFFELVFQDQSFRTVDVPKMLHLLGNH
ncbi:unnamed protein product [Thlaspi arvense]|uniref:Uncharacterized protein n=1 Tax=Thlaspi arvense TaxID=13288 RepID=A0AAU9T1I0_THLAR|nr:unnamed protein product [Thlaspi arvense]